jgi:hypothetical protein
MEYILIISAALHLGELFYIFKLRSKNIMLNNRFVQYLKKLDDKNEKLQKDNYSLKHKRVKS